LPAAIAVLDAEGGVDTDAETTEAIVEEEADNEVAVGIGSPKRAAMVCRGMLLPSAQHRFEVPQHQVNESTAPVQGVTWMSLLPCEELFSSLASVAYTDARRLYLG
jgi:hypothetical protein